MTQVRGQSPLVAQAAGIVSQQAECSLEEALGRIRDCASSMGRTVDQIATAVVEERMRFAPARRAEA